MRFGCCLNMNAAGPDKTGIECIETIAKLGYDYVELPLAETTALDDEAFAQLKERVAKSGIKCETCNNFFPKTIRLTGPVVDHEAVMAHVRKALGRANELGVQYVVFGSGPAKSTPAGFPYEEGYKQVVALLKEIAPIARENNITIVIEPLRKAESNITNTFKEGVEMAKDVNDPNVRVLVDFYHMSVENEPVQNLVDYGAEFLRHTHFANPEGRVFPVDPEEAAYRPYVEALRKAGYDQRVSCEAFCQSTFEEDAKNALKLFKEIF